MKKWYEQGGNVSAYLREKYGADNPVEVIEIAYDLQAGTYTEAMKNATISEQRKNITRELARRMTELLPHPASLLEAGVGEGNNLAGLLTEFNRPFPSYGFDISWSRLAFARKYLREQGHSTTLFTGNLLEIPCADNSFDIICTCQAIEPNRGFEIPILRELFRVARRYLFLLEPSYELADAESRKRMDFHGYITNLRGAAEELGYEVLEYQAFPFVFNPLNPTALLIIRKNAGDEPMPDGVLACPQFKTPLKNLGGALYSEAALRVYPIIDGIPCLRVDNGIVASKYADFVS